MYQCNKLFLALPIVSSGTNQCSLKLPTFYKGKCIRECGVQMDELLTKYFSIKAKHQITLQVHTTGWFLLSF